MRLLMILAQMISHSDIAPIHKALGHFINKKIYNFMTIQEKIEHIQRVAKFPRCSGLEYPSGAMAKIAKESLDIINALQDKILALQLDIIEMQEKEIIITDKSKAFLI
jgi:hypothetical protein